MAHFARLEDNIVTDIVVIGNDDCKDEDGNESEAVGIVFLKDMFGQDTVWKQTSYNDNIRQRYASIGDTYNADIDAFVCPKPFPSWTINSENGEWEPPIERPADTETHYHLWDEENQQWVQSSFVE